MSDPSTQTAGGAGWQPDPTGRHQLRYWDGQAWTDSVSDNGVNGSDPVNAPVPSTVGYGYSAGPNYQLSSKGKRFGALILEILLVIVTLFIGWIVWSVVLWGKGQTPAKSLMKMRVLKLDQGRAANIGEMALREVVGKWVLGFLPFYGLIDGIVVLADEKAQGLHDKIAGTVVIDDPNDAFAPR